jgi:hypothetical protein
VTRNLPKAVAAEVRFVEEGHHVFGTTGEGHYRVVSDSRPGVTYEVTVTRWTDLLRASCDCPAGNHSRHGTPVPCKHSAGVLRRLEREGLARFDTKTDTWRLIKYTPPEPLSEAELDELFRSLQ